VLVTDRDQLIDWDGTSEKTHNIYLLIQNSNGEYIASGGSSVTVNVFIETQTQVQSLPVLTVVMGMVLVAVVVIVLLVDAVGAFAAVTAVPGMTVAKRNENEKRNIKWDGEI